MTSEHRDIDDVRAMLDVRSSDISAETRTFRISDGPTVEAVVSFDPDAPCPTCGASARLHGWDLRTSADGFEVFRCPSCSGHVAIGTGAPEKAIEASNTVPARAGVEANGGTITNVTQLAATGNWMISISVPDPVTGELRQVEAPIDVGWQTPTVTDGQLDRMPTGRGLDGADLLDARRATYRKVSR